MVMDSSDEIAKEMFNKLKETDMSDIESEEHELSSLI